MGNGNKILVLETDPDLRFALERISLGPEVQMHFADPAEWTNLTGDFALTLADDSLLYGSGESLPLTTLKKRFNCPVILMTNTGNRRIEAYARESGASSVLFKPFSAGELRRQIGKVLGAGIETPHLVAAGAGSKESGGEVFRPVEFGGQIASDQVFDHLFVELEKRQPLEEGLDAFDVVERHLVKRALLACDGNQSQASRFLGITRNTLRKRIKKYGLTSLLAGEESADSEDE